jgi:hypothetical protein
MAVLADWEEGDGAFLHDSKKMVVFPVYFRSKGEPVHCAAMKIDIKIGEKWRAAEREEPSGVLMSLKTGVCCEAPPLFSEWGPHEISSPH